MSLLQYSDYNNDEKSISGGKFKNKTVKSSANRPKITIENLANIDDETELNDFKEESLEHPKKPPNDENITVQPVSQTNNIAPSEIANNDYINYYQQQVKRYNDSIQSNLNQKMSNDNLASPYNYNSNYELQQKLDNILYLLEEQKSEQTKLVNEELILYLFLGVFVIFVLDSFVKVGKYTR